MRISDWSSDVCSSDLDINAQPGDASRPKLEAFKMVGLALGLVVGATAIYFGFLNPGGQNRSVTQVASDTSASSDRNDDQLQSQLGEIREVRLKDGSREIGRASCRERVCQYV